MRMRHGSVIASAPGLMATLARSTETALSMAAGVATGRRDTAGHQDAVVCSKGSVWGMLTRVKGEGELCRRWWCIGCQHQAVAPPHLNSNDGTKRRNTASASRGAAAAAVDRRQEMLTGDARGLCRVRMVAKVETEVDCGGRGEVRRWGWNVRPRWEHLSRREWVRVGESVVG